MKRILSSLDTAKSIGDDNVSPYVLKSCSSTLCEPLTALFRRICYSSTFPTSWKISRITPIYKKRACSNPANYCPIAVLSRVLEQLLKTQLQRQILPHIPPEQFGFLKGSSTSDTGVFLASTITTAINHQAEVRLVALDIKEAFDHVQWDGLLEHLWSIGCHGKVFHLFKSYLSDRYIRVVTPIDSSDHHSISAGLPQGAIWSSLLLNLYIRLLPGIPKHCLVIGYADDHTLVITIPHKENCAIAAAHLNAVLAALREYGTCWNIEFAPVKTFSLVISLKSDISDHPPLYLIKCCSYP